MKSMNRRVFIVHGWGGNPKEGWFPWLRNELEKRNFEVSVPEMPDTNHPLIGSWVRTLAEVVGTPDSETYFVGHSIGCQTIFRYLETIGQSAGGIEIGRASCRERV